MEYILPVLGVLLAAATVQCNSTGAPRAACADLRPQHGFTAQTDSSPFELDVEMFQDLPDDVVTPFTEVQPTHSYSPSTTYNSKHHISQGLVTYM